MSQQGAVLQGYNNELIKCEFVVAIFTVDEIESADMAEYTLWGRLCISLALWCLRQKHSVVECMQDFMFHTVV